MKGQLLSVALLCLASFSKDHPVAFCPNQPTPLNGRKWCNFTLSANEVGSKCYFTCNEGYYLTETPTNECVKETIVNMDTFMFSRRPGLCLPRAPEIQLGDNGPYQIVAKTHYQHWVVQADDSLIDDTRLSARPFYVKRPGLTEEHDSVSIFISPLQDNHAGIMEKPSELDAKYIINMEHTLMVHPAILDGMGAMDFMMIATFILHKDYFYPGYAAFESSERDGMFIIMNNRELIMGKPNSTSTKQRASFQWKTA